MKEGVFPSEEPCCRVFSHLLTPLSQEQAKHELGSFQGSFQGWRSCTSKLAEPGPQFHIPLLWGINWADFIWGINCTRGWPFPTYTALFLDSNTLIYIYFVMGKAAESRRQGQPHPAQAVTALGVTQPWG